MLGVPFDPTHDYAQRLDAADQLAVFRERFVVTDPALIYMDGNSLGRLTHATAARMRSAVDEEWGAQLIRGWGNGWYEAPARVGDQIGALLGAAPGQVIVCDSTSVNLFKLITAALTARPDRTKIVTDELNFPSDLYLIQGCVKLLGDRHRIVAVPSSDGITPDLAQLAHAIDEETALVTLSHVTFKSGFLYDMEAVTRRAHEVGALVLWDLSHSVGALPIALDACEVDLAVGCTYKYLNGGPGAPAFLYVRAALQESLVSPIWGWFGQASPFGFDLDYTPAPGIARFLAGTPPVLSLTATESALETLIDAGMDRIREKSVRQCEYLIALSDAVLAPLGFVVGSPRDARQRGSHVSIRHPEGYRINRALIAEMHVVPDFREPDNLRLGIAPLYTSYSDVWQTVERIRCVVSERRYAQYSAVRASVT